MTCIPAAYPHTRISDTCNIDHPMMAACYGETPLRLGCWEAQLRTSAISLWPELITHSISETTTNSHHMITAFTRRVLERRTDSGDQQSQCQCQQSTKQLHFSNPRHRFRLLHPPSVATRSTSVPRPNAPQPPRCHSILTDRYRHTGSTGQRNGDKYRPREKA
jgi:hypothetical protein